MTITETHPEALVAPPDAGRALQGVVGWATTAEHRNVGRLYAGFALLAGAASAVIGVLLGIERLDPDAVAFLQADSTFQLSTLLRVSLPFLVVAPLLLGIAIAVVPAQVGSRALAFPRAAALGFWTWLGGAVLLIAGYADNGGIGGVGKGVSVSIIGFGLVVTGLLIGWICVAATVLTLRAPGMTLERAPMFAWASFVTAVFALVSLPVLLANLAYFYVSYRYGHPLGESHVLMNDIGWAVAHPGTALYALPALGFIADVVPTFARVRQPVRIAVFSAIGLAGMLAVGADVQRGVYKDVVYQPLMILSCVSAVLPVFIVMALCGLALKSGKPKVAAPLVFALISGLVLLLGSALAALMPWRKLNLLNPTVPEFDSSRIVNGTVYQSGQANLVLLAGLLAGIGAIAYWAPRLWGRLDDKKILPLALTGLGGALLVGVPEIILGFYKQPIDQVTFSINGPSGLLNALVMVGWVLVLLTIVGALALVLTARHNADEIDPWEGQTLEFSNPTADLWVGSSAPLADRPAGRNS
jgi:heme/copper-type cytochrome/quinol oxidase subunit 1